MHLQRVVRKIAAMSTKIELELISKLSWLHVDPTSAYHPYYLYLSLGTGRSLVLD